MLGGPSVDRVTSQATPSRQTDAMKVPPTAKLYGASRLVAPDGRLLRAFAVTHAGKRNVHEEPFAWRALHERRQRALKKFAFCRHQRQPLGFS